MSADLVAAARAAAEGSYSPYSGFRVGAAVRSADGTVYTSANVENASYAVAQCAEANVVNYAASQGHRLLPGGSWSVLQGTPSDCSMSATGATVTHLRFTSLATASS